MAVGFGTQIQSNLASKHLLDADNIKGGYCIVENSTARDNLPVASGNDDGVVTVGSLVFNKGDGKFYQYKQTSSSPLTYGWVEALVVPSNVITYTHNSSTGENQINLPINAMFHDDIIPTNATQVFLGGSDNYFYKGFISNLFVNDAEATNGFNVFCEEGSIDEGSYRKDTCTFEYDPRESVGAIKSHYYHYDEGVESESTYVVTFPYKRDGEIALVTDIPSFGTTAGTMAEGNHTHSYLPLSGGTLTGSLGIKSGVGISDDSGNGMLVYKPSSWTGVSNAQWGVGATNCQGVIRSDANSLIHYRGSAAYTIYDSYNYPSCDTAATANTVAKRDSRGYLKCVYLNTSNSTEDINNYSGAVATFQSTDGWLRKTSVANFFKNFGWVSSKFIMAFVKLTVSTNGAISALQYQKIFGDFTLTASTTGAVTNTISNTANGIVITCSTAARFTGFCTSESYVRIGNANSGGVTGGGAPFYNGSTKYICIAFKHSSYNSGYGIFIIIGSTETF